MSNSNRQGQIRWISGAVIIATGISDIEMGEIVEVGNEHLAGEVIGIGA